MRYLMFVLVFFIAGCATSGRVVRTTIDPATGKSSQVALSNYFQSKAMLADGTVQAHLIVTLGKERVPKGVKVQVSRLQERIEEVTEIYFTNKGSVPVQLSNMKLVGEIQTQEILPKAITLAPGQWVKSEAIVSTASIYRAEYDTVLFYEYLGKQHQVPLPQIRTPVDQLSK